MLFLDVISKSIVKSIFEDPGVCEYVTLLHTDSGCQVFVVGTAHVSEKSVDDVKTVIGKVKPRTIFLELCRQRQGLLNPVQHTESTSFNSLLTRMKSGKENTFMILLSWLMAKTGEQLEVQPGEEFRVAYQESLLLRSRVILGDRPIQITLARAWRILTTWEKIKLIFHILCGGVFMESKDKLNELVEEMKGSDMLTNAMRELEESFPKLKTVLLDERDAYMAETLRRAANSMPFSTTVAVVGLGHMRGIRRVWQTPIELDSLLNVPRKESWNISFTTLLIPLSILSVASYSLFKIFYRKTKKHV